MNKAFSVDHLPFTMCLPLTICRAEVTVKGEWKKALPEVKHG